MNIQELILALLARVEEGCSLTDEVSCRNVNSDEEAEAFDVELISSDELENRVTIDFDGPEPE